MRKQLSDYILCVLTGFMLGCLFTSSIVLAKSLTMVNQPPEKIVEIDPVVMPEARLSAADLYLVDSRFSEAEKYSDEDIELLARVTYAEAGNQSEYGQRLVIDTILNRVDDPRFKETDIRSVIYAPKQFDVVTNGTIWMYTNWGRCKHLVLEELCNRTNSEVIAFRTRHYHKWGTPAFQVGDHYFSK